jgi:predicted RNase H-like HicB family nuclease
MCLGDGLVEGSHGVPMSVNEKGNGKAESVVIAVTFTQAPGRGWVADAPEIRSVAQGDTRQEALENLLELVNTYPDLLAEVKESAARDVELVTV